MGLMSGADSDKGRITFRLEDTSEGKYGGGGDRG